MVIGQFFHMKLLNQNIIKINMLKCIRIIEMLRLLHLHCTFYMFRNHHEKFEIDGTILKYLNKRKLLFITE